VPDSLKGRLLVATPYVSAGADSAPAVQVGIGMRERMSKIVEGDFNVLTSILSL